MKKVLFILSVLCVVSIMFSGCDRAVLSSPQNSTSQVDQNTAPVVELEPITFVTFDLDGPGDMGIRLPMNDEQQSELLSLLKVETWSEAHNIPEMGLSAVLTVVNDTQEQILCVCKYEKQTLLLFEKDGEKTLYTAPYEVFEKASEFAAYFEEKKEPTVPSTPNTMPPTLMVDDILYTSTGKILVAEPAPEAIIGTIESVVHGSSFPTENGQANFPAEGAEYAYINDGVHKGILVSINNEWTYFKARED